MFAQSESISWSTNDDCQFEYRVERISIFREKIRYWFMYISIMQERDQLKANLSGPFSVIVNILFDNDVE